MNYRIIDKADEVNAENVVVPAHSVVRICFKK